jgi:hypothetical protein
MVILAIIGLIFLYIFTSRSLIKLGNFLEKLGDRMIENSSKISKINEAPWRNDYSKDIYNTSDKIRALKETEEDTEFRIKVSKEIDELLDESKED